MLGRVILSEPPIERWGDGSDGNATWSNNLNSGSGGWWTKNADGKYSNAKTERTHKSGFYQFNNLEISDGTHIEVQENNDHVVPQKLIIFARNEIKIGDNVLINAGRNNWERQSFDYQAHANNFNNILNVGTGGGGGGGGSGRDGKRGDAGFDGQHPHLYYTTGRGASKSNSHYEVASEAGGYSQGGNVSNYNGNGHYGSSGWPSDYIRESAFKNHLATTFSFSTRTDLISEAPGADDFPIWQGGQGGDGGTGRWRTHVGGNGGRGGGTIILVAPKITIGSNFVASVAGNTRYNGHGVSRSIGSNLWDNSLDNMNGSAFRDSRAGGGGGGGGGGGFMAIVTSPSGLSGFSEDSIGGTQTDGRGGNRGRTYGGKGRTGGPGYKVGADGARGGSGQFMRGEKGIIAGGISWAPSGEWTTGGGSPDSNIPRDAVKVFTDHVAPPDRSCRIQVATVDDGKFYNPRFGVENYRFHANNRQSVPIAGGYYTSAYNYFNLTVADMIDPGRGYQVGDVVEIFPPATTSVYRREDQQYYTADISYRVDGVKLEIKVTGVGLSGNITSFENVINVSGGSPARKGSGQFKYITSKGVVMHGGNGFHRGVHTGLAAEQGYDFITWIGIGSLPKNSR